MKSGSKALGFTIIETLIFLAVSSAILVSALALIGGAQNKTQFSQAINDLDQQVNTVINNVLNGYYPSSNNFSCTNAGSSVSLAVGTTEQGQNEDCIFIGKVMHFTKDDDFYVFSVAGLRQSATGKEVTNLAEAKPRAISPTSSDASIPDVTDSRKLNNGLKVYSINKINTGSIGIFTTFPDYSSVGVIKSAASSVQLVPITGSLLDDDQKAAAENINSKAGSSTPTPIGEVKICIDSGSTDQHAVLTIGGNNRLTNTTLDIKNGNSAGDSSSC